MRVISIEGLLAALSAVGLAAVARAAPQQAGKPPSAIGWVEGTPVLPLPPPPPGQAATGPPPAGPKEPGIAETEVAARRGMPAILYFHWPVSDGPAGVACATFSVEILRDPNVIALSQQFVCIRVSGKTCPRPVLAKYGVAKFPTVHFLVCTQKVLSTVTSEKKPEHFLETMQAAIATNRRILEAFEERRGQLKALLGKGDEAKDKGRYAEAVKLYERVIATSGGDPLELDARLRIEEVRMIGIFEEGETLVKDGKYEEARGRLQVVADFELSCRVRDKARALLPDCDMAVQFSRAVALRRTDPLAAIEALGKIAANEEYEGPFKAKAEAMIVEIKESWDKKSRSYRPSERR
ncbi:MAG: hypothetical protein L0216_02850 [Planctomycetales bacterium]|nr:hypothetical protein [Planctomycetales bacterium]